MKTYFLFLVLIICLCNCFISCRGQQTFGIDYLKLDKVIPLPYVKGRIDHLDVNLIDQIVYIAALGNNTVEAINLNNGKIIFSIKGLDEPQGVAYIPDHEEIFVANGGNGTCYFYNARTFEKVAEIQLPSDADDVRYDSIEKKIYVGYGQGGIGIINADKHLLIGTVKLPAHPESFQLDKRLERLYVNLPDAHIVGVIDLRQLKLIDKWPGNKRIANFPMAIDPVTHKVFIGYRHPPQLITMDGKNGKVINVNNVVGDADDLYYDQVSGKVYVSGGDGYINIFRQEGQNNYKQIANIATAKGARTSLLIPELKVFIVAVRAGLNKKAELLVYKLAD